MSFDLENYKERQRIINYGRQRWPQEKNITLLYEMAAALLGIKIKPLNTTIANHLPAPKETGPFFECPKCHQKKLVLYGICKTCKESKSGRFNSKMECPSCGYTELSPKHIVTLLTEFGFDFNSRSKSSLGIRTITDKGAK